MDADFNNINDTVDVDYEQETEKTEATYKDKEHELDLKGNEAMDKLDNIFSNFDFNKDTSQEEVIKAVQDAFKLPEDAAIDLEITFTDGTNKEYQLNNPN